MIYRYVFYLVSGGIIFKTLIFSIKFIRFLFTYEKKMLFASFICYFDFNVKLLPKPIVVWILPLGPGFPNSL